MVLGTRCKAKVGTEQKEISIEEALSGIGEEYSCVNPQCGQPVKAFRNGKDGRAAHFQHFKANEKCDLGHGLSKQPTTR
jgi:hypothetical protein